MRVPMVTSADRVLLIVHFFDIRALDGMDEKIANIVRLYVIVLHVGFREELGYKMPSSS